MEISFTSEILHFEVLGSVTFPRGRTDGRADKYIFLGGRSCVRSTGGPAGGPAGGPKIRSVTNYHVFIYFNRADGRADGPKICYVTNYIFSYHSTGRTDKRTDGPVFSCMICLCCI